MIFLNQYIVTKIHLQEWETTSNFLFGKFLQVGISPLYRFTRCDMTSTLFGHAKTNFFLIQKNPHLRTDATSFQQSDATPEKVTDWQTIINRTTFMGVILILKANLFVKAGSTIATKSRCCTLLFPTSTK